MIITGCQRSGTMTCAKIFGINHEEMFTPTTTQASLRASYISELRSESSWMAQPFISFLLERNESIIHLVRHPLNVIRSLMGIGFFNPVGIEGHKPYRDFVFQHLPSLNKVEDELLKCIYYYLWWNAPFTPLVEQGKVARIRIEDIYTKQRWNQRNRAKLYWDDFPRDTRGELQEMAKEYSYEC